MKVTLTFEIHDGAILNIFGEYWTIRIKSKGMKGNLGLCHDDIKEIWLKKGQPNNEMMHTFLHELQHATIRRASVMQSLESGVEEILVDQNSTVILENCKAKYES